jgi:hypothetical protein
MIIDLKEVLVSTYTGRVLGLMEEKGFAVDPK